MAEEVKGLARLKRQLAALTPAARETIADGLAKGAGMMADAIERAAPDERLAHATGWTFGDAPKGSLAASDATSRTQALGALKLHVTVYTGDHDVFWARWDEFGTRPHEIVPKKPTFESGKPSRLVFEVDGKVGYAMKVHHPGEKARPFFWPSVRAYKQPVKALVARSLNKAAKIAAATR